MSVREAFKVFIRHELDVLVEDGKSNLTSKEVEHIANELENDPEFYKAFGEFLSEFIEDSC